MKNVDTKIARLQDLIEDLFNDSPVGPLIGGIVRPIRRDPKTGDVLLYIQETKDSSTYQVEVRVNLQILGVVKENGN